MSLTRRVHSVFLVTAVLAAIGAGIWLRAHGLGRESLWHDEAQSALMARLEPFQIVHSAATTDVHPPLYYLLLHWFTRSAGTESEAWLRAPSVGFGLLGLLATFLVARQLGGQRVSLLATALVALSVFHVQYSREARMYTLLYAAATLSMYFFLTLRSGRRYSGLLWIVCTLATVFAHAVGLFVVLAQHLCWIAVRLIAPEAVPPLRRWVMLNLGVAFAAAPWAWVVLSQQRRMGGFFWIAPPYLSQPMDILAQLAGSYTLLGLLFALACFGVVTRLRDAGTARTSRSSLVILLMWGLVPLLAPWLVSYISVPILIPRIVIVCLAPLMIAAAFGLAALGPRFAIPAVSGVFALSGLLAWQHTEHLRKEDWRGLVAYVEPQLKDSDLLLFHESSRRKGFQYYSPKPVSRVAGFPERRFAAGEKVERTELSELQRIVETPERIWVVVSSSNDPEQLIQQALSVNFRMSERREFRRLTVERFDRR